MKQKLYRLIELAEWRGQNEGVIEPENQKEFDNLVLFFENFIENTVQQNRHGEQT